MKFGTEIIPGMVAFLYLYYIKNKEDLTMPKKFRSEKHIKQRYQRHKNFEHSKYHLSI